MDDEAEVLELLYRLTEALEAINRQLLGIKDALRDIADNQPENLPEHN